MAGDSARANPRKSNPERRMSLGAHLIELRKRLTRAAFAVLGGTIIGWMIYDLSWLGDLLDPAIPGAADVLHGQGTWSAISYAVFCLKKKNISEYAEEEEQRAQHRQRQ